MNSIIKISWLWLLSNSILTPLSSPLIFSSPAFTLPSLPLIFGSKSTFNNISYFRFAWESGKKDFYLSVFRLCFVPEKEKRFVILICTLSVGLNYFFVCLHSVSPSFNSIHADLGKQEFGVGLGGIVRINVHLFQISTGNAHPHRYDE